MQSQTGRCTTLIPCVCVALPLRQAARFALRLCLCMMYEGEIGCISPPGLLLGQGTGWSLVVFTAPCPWCDVCSFPQMGLCQSTGVTPVQAQQLLHPQVVSQSVLHTRAASAADQSSSYKDDFTTPAAGWMQPAATLAEPLAQATLPSTPDSRRPISENC